MSVSTAPVYTSSEAGRRSRRFALVSAASIVVATVANLGLYVIGRVANAALRIDPGAGESNHLIVPGDVAWKTALPLGLAALVLVLIARRSGRWTTITIVAGVVAVLISIPFVLTGAHDLTTGFLLAGMHTIAGLAYALIGTAARAHAKS